MKKNKTNMTSQFPKISPEDAVQFLEDIRTMTSNQDEPTVAISLRIPANILRLLKIKATTEGKKYQSLIIELLRQSLK